MVGRERRQYERFKLRLRAAVQEVGPEKAEALNVLSKDVSAGGAFLISQKLVPRGTGVKMGLILASDGVKKLAGVSGLLRVAGTVVRSGPAGFAIHFKGKPEVIPLTH
jgi:hypothetical protein